MRFHTLIASDLDGTLLMDPVGALPDELFQTIRNLQEKGFLFCVASGRPYRFLRELFAPVADEIIFAAENGARVYAKGELIHQVRMPEPQCWELAADIHAQPECEARIYIQDQVYRVAKDDLVADFLHLPSVQAMIPVQALEELNGSVTMVTAFCPFGAQKPASILFPKWQEHTNASMTTPRCLDFSDTDKSAGLQIICDRYHIRRTNTIAFGNSFNDISMLDFAAYAYIMEDACGELKERFPRRCVSVTEELRRISSTEGGNRQ